MTGAGINEHYECATSCWVWLRGCCCRSRACSWAFTCLATFSSAKQKWRPQRKWHPATLV